MQRAPFGLVQASCHFRPKISPRSSEGGASWYAWIPGSRRTIAWPAQEGRLRKNSVSCLPLPFLPASYLPITDVEKRRARHVVVGSLIWLHFPLSTAADESNASRTALGNSTNSKLSINSRALGSSPPLPANR